jgi:DHA2 family multidrug resistance protein-like MFS transporter
MALLLLLAPVLLPEFKDPKPGRFDFLSVPLSMAAVLPLVYGIKEIPSEGFEPLYVASIVVGLVFAALFVRRQRTVESPMISPALFRSRGFGPAVTLNLISAFAMMGSAYFTTQYLQAVLGKSALEAALWALAPTVFIGFAAPLATVLVQRGVHRGSVVTVGFLTSACGYGLLTLTGTDSLWTALAGAGVLASGAVIVGSQLTDLALGAAPAEKAGAASSLLETGQEFGGALGMAVLGSIGTAVYRHEIGDAPAEAKETLGGALAVAQHLPGRAGDALLASAREAFTSGMHIAAVAGGVILLGAAVLALRGLRGVAAPQQEDQRAPELEEATA